MRSRATSRTWATSRIRISTAPLDALRDDPSVIPVGDFSASIPDPFTFRGPEGQKNEVDAAGALECVAKIASLDLPSVIEVETADRSQDTGRDRGDCSWTWQTLAHAYPSSRRSQQVRTARSRGSATSDSRRPSSPSGQTARWTPSNSPTPIRRRGAASSDAGAATSTGWTSTTTPFNRDQTDPDRRQHGSQNHRDTFVGSDPPVPIFDGKRRRTERVAASEGVSQETRNRRVTAPDRSEDDRLDVVYICRRRWARPSIGP